MYYCLIYISWWDAGHMLVEDVQPYLPKFLIKTLENDIHEFIMSRTKCFVGCRSLWLLWIFVQCVQYVVLFIRDGFWMMLQLPSKFVHYLWTSCLTMIEIITNRRAQISSAMFFKTFNSFVTGYNSFTFFPSNCASFSHFMFSLAEHLVSFHYERLNVLNVYAVKSKQNHAYYLLSSFRVWFIFHFYIVFGCPWVKDGQARLILKMRHHYEIPQDGIRFPALCRDLRLEFKTFKVPSSPMSVSSCN